MHQRKHGQHSFFERHVKQGLAGLALTLLAAPSLALGLDLGLDLGTPSNPAELYRERYESRMQDNELMSKITDNRGNGFEDLYGTRNMRVVLHGIYYRGGGNNAYHRTAPRDNMNPMPQDGLNNLCAEGFGRAVYFYDTNWKPQSLSCTSRLGGTNTLEYLKQSNLYSAQGMRPLLEEIHACIKGQGSCPIYGHCWNGWHASGFAAAVVLRQFCGFSPEAAVSYWIDGTDSPGNSNLPAIKKAIRAFVPYADLAIAPDTQADICPPSPYASIDPQ